MANSESSQLKRHLDACLRSVDELEANYGSQHLFLGQFKVFLQSLFGLLVVVKVEVSEPQNKYRRTKTSLCLSQVAKVLTLFGSGSLFKQNNHRQQCVWYLCERLRWCLTELCRLLVTPSPADDEPSGSFLLGIDLALDLLEAADHLPADFQQLLDDLVCQALTVANVAGSFHYQEITAACHKLLNEHKEFSEKSQDNENEQRLLTASMSASLRCLEERVSCALLKMFLSVFSEPHWPLKQIVRACSRAAEPRSATDLDPCVAQLDDHSERIVLIGQFAVSCCEDKKAVAGIRCCLASLESVDNYLVPAIKAFYLSPSSPNCRHFVRFLCDHWQDEVAALQLHLYDVIDSRALLCAVRESLEEMFDELDHAKDGVLCDNVKKSIRSYGWLLYKNLSKTPDKSIDFALSAFKEIVLENEVAFKENKNIKKKKKHLFAVLDSLLQIIEKKVVLKNETTESFDQEASSKIDVDQDDASNIGYKELKKTTTGSSQVEEPKSIQDVSLDVSFQTEGDNSKYSSYRPQWLQKKLSTARKVYENKSVNSTNNTRNSLVVENGAVFTPKTPKGNRIDLKSSEEFKTPKNMVKPEVQAYLSRGRERLVTLYERTPRRDIEKRVMDETDSEETSRAAVKDMDSLVLDITGILENLSALASTLTSFREADSTDITYPSPEQRQLPSLDKKTSTVGSQYLASGQQSDSQWLSLASVRTDQVSDVNTPQRMQDLKDLDDRIQLLKML